MTSGPSGNETPNVFISHPIEDANRVSEIHAALWAAGVRAWVFGKDQVAGEDWQAQVERVLRTARVILLVTSVARNARPGYYDTEARLALERARKAASTGQHDRVDVIPVRLDPSPIPEELRHLPSVDLFGLGGVETLVARVAGILAELPARTELPEALVEACRAERCVLVVGGGVAWDVGVPSWTLLVHRLCEEARAQALLSDASIEDIQRARASGDVRMAADLLLDAVGTRRSALTARIPELLGGGRVVEPPRFLTSLSRLRFAGVVNTSLDGVADLAFPEARYERVDPDDATALQRLLGARHANPGASSSPEARPFYLRLFGDGIGDPERARISPSEFGSWAAQNRLLTEFIEATYLSSTLVFVGMSDASVMDLLATLRLPRAPQTPHFAFVRIDDMAWRARGISLQRRFNVTALPFVAGAAANPLDAICDDLAGRAHVGAGHVTPRAAPGRLARVRVHNIGPFVDFALDLDPSWNLVLGNNGAGKTTLLRAIAAGLAGRDAGNVGERLLRKGTTSAEIELTSSAGRTYRTLIERTASRAEVRTEGGQPREVEGWLTLAFPAIRGFTTRPDVRGSTSVASPLDGDALGPAAFADLEPLFAGALDPRGDQIGPWLWRLDHQRLAAASKSPSEDPAAAGLAERLRRRIDAFARIVGNLVGEAVLGIGEFDFDAKSVQFKTPDGSLPLDRMSQGVGSLLSWVGVMFRRLCEVFAVDDAPWTQPVIVLVDELDAHLHPQWQRVLVSRVGPEFTAAQIIATTHSPLVVAGQDAGRIVRLARDEQGAVRRQRLTADAAIGNAAQLLTGPLFEAGPAVDSTTSDMLVEYRECLRGAADDPAAAARAAALRQAIAARLPRGEDRIAVRVMSAVRRVVSAELASSPQEARASALESVEALVDEVVGRSFGGDDAAR